jgi:hypothetical protein
MSDKEENKELSQEEIRNIVKFVTMVLSNTPEEFCEDMKGRKVNRTTIENGLTISTVNTPDLGFETAIVEPEGGAYPVERYDAEYKAVLGHDAWIEKAKLMKSGDTIQMLRNSSEKNTITIKLEF